MDPQSQSFTPYSQNTTAIVPATTTSSASSTSNDSWKLQSDIMRVQQVQADHSDRISRLERKQEDDARMKSVWGNSSPFPSVLSGTPQQVPLQQPPGDHFRSFDDETSHMMGSLHLDAEDEPRRGLGATSRANSVRFDESANQNHFSHSSRPSVEFLSRTSSGIGGLQMTERTSSHKSEGRASSAHSMRSAASGRANSLNLDTATYVLGGEPHRSSADVPGMAPGLVLLGAVPAIIRCWMNTNFKHDALLYAAVCTGSYKSFLDLRLIRKLGFEAVIRTNDDGLRIVELPIFFPEAVVYPGSSRSASPTPQLPSLIVEFRVIEQIVEDEQDKAIQIFLGSDVLRAHNADILFSSNTLTLFNNERHKVSIPLSRPENEASFNGLYVTSGWKPQPYKMQEPSKEQPYLNGLGHGSSTASVVSTNASPPPGKHRPPGAFAAEHGTAESAKGGAMSSDKQARPSSQQSTASRPSLTLLNTRTDREEASADNGQQSGALRSGSHPAMWSNWRKDGTTSSATTQSTGMDWANASRNRESMYQRKETGIKVLKPKAATRTFSITPGSTSTSTPSPAADAKSRFFDDGRRRSTTESITSKPSPASLKENIQSTPTAASATSNVPNKTKTNPIGGASAFSWLNPGGAK